MTDRQEAMIWGHPRNDEGRLIPPRSRVPAASQTLGEELAAAGAIMAALGVSAEDRQKAEAVIHAGHKREG